MPLESTVVCLDNSEYTRNGDFFPNRLDAERDAAGKIINAKLSDNAESSCAVLSMGGKINVLATLTTDRKKLQHSLHEVTSTGTCDFVSGIMVAQLMLRHRETKNHRQRIITFVGSPITATEKELVQLGKKLKKSSVNVDIISFGEEEKNEAKLEAFINAVNKEDESHLVVVPSGSHSISNAVMSSPLFAQSSHSGGPDMSGFGGLDLDEDPQLAMALRMSLEEERQRQQRAQADSSQAEGSADGEDQQQQQSQGGDMDVDADDELAAALLASQQDLHASENEDDATPADDAPESVQQSASSASEPNFAAMTEEEMLQYALQMSMQETNVNQDSSSSAMDTSADDANVKGSSTTGNSSGLKEAEPSSSSSATKQSEPEAKPAAPVKDELAEAASDVFGDPDFLASVLGDLPGVDQNDASVQEMLASLQGGSGDNNDSDKKKKKKKPEEEPEMEIDDVDD